MRIEVPFDRGQADERNLRAALGRYATGVAVATTSAQSQRFGLTINSFAALSMRPPLVLWSLKDTAPSKIAFVESGWFAINVLKDEHVDLARRFAQPALDKFEGLAFEAGLGGAPVLQGSLATFECELESTTTGGDHVILVGRVRRASFCDARPLVFSSGRFASIAEDTLIGPRGV